MSRSLRQSVAAAIVLLAIGCGAPEPTGTAPPPPDEDAARQLIATALDAWTQGKAGDLARRRPPLRFADDDRAAGLKLISYEITGPPQGRDFPVVLDLRDARGHSLRREARYQVVTGDAPAVLRSDP